MAKIAEILNNVVSDSGVEISSLQPLLTNPVTGTGTTNYIPKFTGTSAIGNSDLITDGSGNLAIAQGNAPTQALNIYRAGSTQTVMAAGNSNTGLNGTFFGVDANGNGIINTTGAFANIFSTNGSERMRLTSGGLLGLGTSSPSRTLSIGGAANAYMDFKSSSNRTYTIGSDSNGFIVFDDNASAYRMVINASGNLGLGTSAPNAKLEVSAGQLYLNQDYYLQWNVAGSSTIRAGIQGTSGNALAFYNRVGGILTNTMTLDGNGNLGLGVTPSTWYSGSKALQFNTGSIYTYSTDRFFVGQNTYIDGTGVDDYYANGFASRYQQYQGQHIWQTAPSGTANAAITWSTRMTLDNSGNLGLGVAPSAWASAGGSAKGFQLGNGGGLYSSGAGNTLSTLVHAGYYNGTNWIYNYSSVSVGRYEITGANAGSTHAWYNSVGGTAGNSISFTQAMTLDASGRLGIGTTSPQRRLHAVNSIMLSGASAAQEFLIGDDNVRYFSLQTPSGAANLQFNVYGGSNIMTLTSGANVGIGTTSPQRALNIVSNNAQIRISDATAPTTNYWEISSLFFNTNQDFLISNQSGTALTINASRNVGIGTTSPTQLLDIGSNNSTPKSVALRYSSLPNYWASTFDGTDGINTLSININNTSNGSSSWSATDNGNYATSAIQLRTNTGGGYLTFLTSTSSVAPTERMRITSGGQLLVGVTNGINNGMVHAYAPSGNQAFTAQVANNAYSLFQGFNAAGSATFYVTGAGNIVGSGSISMSGSASIGSYLYLASEGTGSVIGDVSTGNYLRFIVSNTERMRITSSGNVGIGTTSPTQALEVSGNILFTNKANAILFGATGVDGTWGAPIITRIGAQLIMSDYSGVQFGGYDGSSYGARMTVLGTGNVGIGTTSPSYKLHVVGSIYASNSLTTAGPITVGMAPAPFWNAKFTDYSDGSGVYIGSVQAGGYKYIAGESYYNNSSYWYSDFTTSTVIGLGGGILKFYTDSGLTANTNFIPTERMRITAAGNVGIGTTSPSQKLEVTGIVRGEAVNVYGSTDPASTSPYLYSPSLGALGFGGNGSEKMRITSGGNVLVGTTTDAGYKLNVNGSFYLGTNAYISYGATYPYTINIANTAGVGDIVLNAGAGSSGYESKINLQGGTSGYLQFSTASAERMRITSGGNVGIGTTSPDTRTNIVKTALTKSWSADVNDILAIENNGTTLVDIRSSNAEAGYLSFSDGDARARGLITYSHASDDMRFNTAGSERMRITSGGNVGIGSSNPTYKLDITANNNASIAIAETSDDPFIWFDRSDGGSSRLAWRLRENATRSLIFETGSSATKYGQTFTEAMRITSGGDIGVSATSVIGSGFGYAGNTGASASAYLQLYNGASGETKLWNTGYYAMIFGNGNSERMRLNSSGELLINTTSDAGDYKLQVNGNVYATGIGYINGGIVGNSSNNLYLSSNSSGGEISFWANQLNTRLMTILGGGDVGIGVSSPSAKLEVNGAIKTAAPSGGTAAAWKLGSRISNTCGLPATYADFTSQFMNTNKVIEIEIGGVTVYVPTVTPGWC